MDMSDLFKRHFAKMHRIPTTLETRKEAMIQERKSKRDSLTRLRRNIDPNMSPYITPAKTSRNEISKEPKPDQKLVKKPAKHTEEEGCRQRLAMLAKWKIERDQRLKQEKAKQKPLFKCYNARPEMWSLENVDKIKGKQIPSSAKKFAPDNHKFTAPSNIKKIDFIYTPIMPKTAARKSTTTTTTAKPKLNDVPLKRESSRLKLQSASVSSKKSTTTKTELQKKTSKVNVRKATPNNTVKVKETSKPKELTPALGKETKSTPIKAVKTPKKVIETKKEVKVSVSKPENKLPRGKTRKTPNVNKTPSEVKTLTKESKTSKGILKENKTPSEVKTLTKESKTPKGILKENKTPTKLQNVKNKEHRTLKGVLKVSSNVKTPNGVVDGTSVKTPIHISPFITVSRGKRQARDEYLNKTNPDDVDEQPETEQLSNNELEAKHFQEKLDLEIVRLNDICFKWKQCFEDPELPEEAFASINVVIGQSNLLITKKFKQFERLIHQCRTKIYEEKMITGKDLHGFWDMIYMQVENLDKRFVDLEKLRDNNWTEPLPEKKAPQAKRGRGRPRKAAINANSKLKELIKARRQQQKDENVSTEEETKCFDIKTPLKQQKPSQTPLSQRKSMRLSLLKNSSKSRCSSSPGLTMMKVSQSIKQNNGLTPAKSILKVNTGKSSTSKKSVAFRQSTSPQKQIRKTLLFREEEKENTPVPHMRVSVPVL